MNDFLESIIKRDPAARSKLSLILTYPGVKAVFFHRIANFFSIAKFSFLKVLLRNCYCDYLNLKKWQNIGNLRLKYVLAS